MSKIYHVNYCACAFCTEKLKKSPCISPTYCKLGPCKFACQLKFIVSVPHIFWSKFASNIAEKLQAVQKILLLGKHIGMCSFFQLFLFYVITQILLSMNTFVGLLNSHFLRSFFKSILYDMPCILKKF